jgi:peptide deformylase
MTRLTILEYPDPRLRRMAVPLARVEKHHQQLIDDMFETMYDAPGVGLAAPQVDAPIRLLVMDVSDNNDQPLVLINPDILARSTPGTMREGCLSVPGYFEEVDRSHEITVRALDRLGKPFELQAEGLMAVCIQHEMDHLDGKLFVDYLTELKRSRIRKKLEKEQRQRSQPKSSRSPAL